MTIFKDTFPHEYLAHLKVLGDHERKVVISFYGLMGKPKLSLEEIAEIFRDPGLNTNKTRNVLSTAMGKLRSTHEREQLRCKS